MYVFSGEFHRYKHSYMYFVSFEHLIYYYILNFKHVLNTFLNESEGNILFYGRNHPLSNFHPSEIIVDKMKFTCAEHYY